MNTLTLSGWTQPSDAVKNALGLSDASIFDYSDYPSPQESFAGLKKFSDVENIIAWSMGGQLAIRAIAAGVLKPKHLTLIAAPYQFMKSADFTEGMDAQTFTTFRDNYASAPERTSSRFHALVAKGDRDMKRILPLLGHHHEVTNTQRWLPWFDDLGRASLREDKLDHFPPTLLIHGSEDAIVPFGQSAALVKKISHATLERWSDVSHAPHLHDPARLLAAIGNHRAAA
jgi:pimeloyl-[acyl-carrier protein] methyl ester esterase